MAQFLIQYHQLLAQGFIVAQKQQRSLRDVDILSSWTADSNTTFSGTDETADDGGEKLMQDILLILIGIILISGTLATILRVCASDHLFLRLKGYRSLDSVNVRSSLSLSRNSSFRTRASSADSLSSIDRSMYQSIQISEPRLRSAPNLACLSAIMEGPDFSEDDEQSV